MLAIHVERPDNVVDDFHLANSLIVGGRWNRGTNSKKREHYMAKRTVTDINSRNKKFWKRASSQFHKAMANPATAQSAFALLKDEQRRGVSTNSRASLLNSFAGQAYKLSWLSSLLGDAKFPMQLRNGQEFTPIARGTSSTSSHADSRVPT
jgi:hypothetical protein